MNLSTRSSGPQGPEQTHNNSTNDLILLAGENNTGRYGGTALSITYDSE
jgi:hypothetical protein